MPAEEQKDDFLAMAFRKDVKSPRTSTKSETKSGEMSASQKKQFETAVNRRIQEIGIKEKQFYYIAENSLRVKLPDEWVQAATEDGFLYYFNEKSDESIWTHPLLDQFKEQYAQAMLMQQQQQQRNRQEGQGQGGEAKNSNNSISKNSNSNPKSPAAWGNGEEGSRGRSRSKRVGSQTGRSDRSDTSGSRSRSGSSGGSYYTRSRSSSLGSQSEGSFVDSPVVRQVTSSKSDKQQQGSNRGGGDNRGQGSSGRSEQKQKTQVQAEEDKGYPSEMQNSLAFEGIDFEGKHPADYWHERFELLNREKMRVQIQMESLEIKLQDTIGKESQLMADRHTLASKAKDCSHKLRDANERAHIFLTNKGAKTVPLAADGDGKTSLDGNLNEVTADAVQMLSQLSSDASDDRGFIKTWEGVSKRLTEEMMACFPSSTADAETRQRTVEDLKLRLEALSQIICAFGEYLPHTERSYLPPLLKHIRQQAPGSTMVPLEVITKSLEEIGASNFNKAETDTLDLVRGDNHPYAARPYMAEGSTGSNAYEISSRVRERLALEPPSTIAAVRKELTDMREKNKMLKDQLELEYKKVEQTQQKYLLSEARLEDSRTREEGLMNKFSQISKSMDELKEGTLKAAQPANKVENGSTNITAADVTQLMDKLSTMTAEVDLSNKRAVEAERRVSDLAKDKTQLTDEQIPMLKLKLERKKEKNKALCSKLVELEQVGKEYYAELQVSLNQNSTYEAQCSDLRVRLERAEKEKDSRIAGQSTKEQTGPTEGHGQLLAAHEELQNNFNNLQDRYRRAREELEDEEIDNKRTQRVNESMVAQIDVVRDELNEKKRELSSMHSVIEDLEEERARLTQEVVVLKKKSIVLNDKITDLQGNIRVFCRVRPPNSKENISASEFSQLVQIPDYNVLDFNEHAYEFDRVFGPDSGQRAVFDEVLPAVRSVMTGSRLCVFAYGQTGSGKTHTMTGPSKDPEGTNKGVNIRALESVFEMAATEPEIKTEVFMSMLEVYNEKVVDLLDGKDGKDKTTGGELPGLEVRVGKGGSFVEGLSEWPCPKAVDVYKLMANGNTNRRMASNHVNEHSSRSHLTILVRVERTHTVTGLATCGFLTLVDLAGSERLKTTAASGQRLREAQHINKSLSALGDVIAALATGQKHIPYRNSKLTFLLQDSLRESSKVLMFCNISPVPDYAAESACSLNFATRCRSVSFGPSTNSVSTGAKLGR